MESSKLDFILDVPVVYTSIYPEGNGEFIKTLPDIFHRQEVIARMIAGMKNDESYH